MTNKLWSNPNKWWQYPLFGLGWFLFWVFFLCLVISQKLFGVKKIDLFVFIHIQAVFYNPWLWWEE